MTERVLVIGGAGYIGSHTCKELSIAGFEPVTFDDLSRGYEKNVRWGPLVRGTIHDERRLIDTIKHYGISSCVHFAAFAYVGESFSAPVDYYRNNVAGSISVVTALIDAGVNKLVFSSSCAVYGEPEELPVTEGCARNPLSPYGKSKMMAEDIIFDCAAASDLRCIALRYFNACGADPEGELTEDHDPETHILPRCLMAAAGIIPHVQLFGMDHPTPDGTCVRDYVHVKDLAIAHVQALARLDAEVRAPVINIGAGTGHSIKDLMAEVEKVVGRPVPVETCPRREGDPACLFADISLARRELGFEPRFSNLEMIVRTAYQKFEASMPQVGQS